MEELVKKSVQLRRLRERKEENVRSKKITRKLQKVKNLHETYLLCPKSKFYNE